MNNSRIVPWLLLSGLTVAISWTSMGAPKNPGKPPAPQRTLASKPSEAPGRIVYQPPRGLGAPKSRVSAATRGQNQGLQLAVLAPDHIGLTTDAQPILYWYLSHLTALPLALTVTAEWVAQPLVETLISSPVHPGVQHVSLADYGVHLEPEVRYRWSITAIPEAEQRSRDLIASGMIQRTELSPVLQQQLAQSAATHAPVLYAAAGLWYDAIDFA